MNLKLSRPLAIFDLEATGPHLAKDRIVEIYILKIHPDGTEEPYHRRVNPKMPIPPEVTKIHGISDEDIKDAPTFFGIAEELMAFLDGCDLGGYNSNRFDIPMLKEEFYRVGLTFSTDDRKLIDVFRIFVKKEARDLSSAFRFYCKKEMVNAHSADADVLATYEVLKSQLDRYEDDLENDMSFLHEFSKDGDFLDSGRRLVRVNDEIQFNFGKHKGRSVKDVLSKEPMYFDWIMKSDFLADTKIQLKKVKEDLGL